MLGGGAGTGAVAKAAVSDAPWRVLPT